MALPEVLCKDAREYWEARDEDWRNIYRALYDYHLSNMVYEGTDDPYALVDNVTRDGDSLADGQLELIFLADEISVSVFNNEEMKRYRENFKEAIDNSTVFGVEPTSLHKLHIRYNLLVFLKRLLKVD